jgi:hypothetical protein
VTLHLKKGIDCEPTQVFHQPCSPSEVLHDDEDDEQAVGKVKGMECGGIHDF